MPRTPIPGTEGPIGWPGPDHDDESGRGIGWPGSLPGSPGSDDDGDPDGDAAADEAR